MPEKSFPAYTFDMYFASIVSFQYHPANPAATRLSLHECADIALEMLKIREVVIVPEVL